MNPDIKLLCSVLENQAETMDFKSQKLFSQWILKTLKSIDNNFTYDYDKYGNLYVKKGNAEHYPCIVAHLDSVHNIIRRRCIRVIGDFVMAFDLDNGCQVGCGADDKVGVAIAIEMFRKHDAIKLFFPLDEESGALGSKKCNLGFFDDCCFMIQPDRNFYEKKDYINFTNQTYVTSKEFDKEIEPYLKKYNYSVAKGSFTDIGEIVRKYESTSKNAPCAFNLSCYINAHSDSEVVYLPLYKDALNLVNDVIKNMSYKMWKVEKKVFFEDYYMFDEETYLNHVFKEVDKCKHQCNFEHIDFEFNSVMFCNKCHKTMGQNYLNTSFI
jgi:putative aminopeptidase FrvX